MAPSSRRTRTARPRFTSTCASSRATERSAEEPTMKPEECTLYSGAAGGAEAEFGAAAERHGIDEVNFTFEGHNDARQRGIRVLTHAELRRGDVSLNYVSKLMHRRFPDTSLFKK